MYNLYQNMEIYNYQIQLQFFIQILLFERQKKAKRAVGVISTLWV